MIVITEQQVAAFADYPSLIAAMEAVFIACAKQDVDNYPFVRSFLRGTQNLFGVKSGCNYTSRIRIRRNRQERRTIHARLA